MDPLLLAYYNKELTYMREMAGEFAAAHPKIARRLGMQGMEVADPFVERLIEAFCFLSARMRIRLDAEFPRFTQHLLEVVYPNYVSPTPSMAVVRLDPSPAEGDLADGFVVPRGAIFRSRIPHNQQTACQFTSGMDVTLWPLEITEAALIDSPSEASLLSAARLGGKTPRSALRLRLKTTNGMPFSAFTGLDRLPLYLDGDEQTATHLFELLAAGSLAALVFDTGTGDGRSRQPAHVVTSRPVEPEGFEPDQGLLPLPWNTFHGHNLVHEYFACPSRFLFLALRDLAPGFAAVQSSTAEIILLLDRESPALSPQVDASRFALFCAPVINLFPMRTDRIEMKPDMTEFHVVADRTRPLDFEIYSISEIRGQRAGTNEEQFFRPLYQTVRSDRGNYGRYFSVRRERRLLSDRTRTLGAQTGHIGTEVFVSLVDQAEAPYADDLSLLSVRALVTNRELPRLLFSAGLKDLALPEAAPVRRVSFIRSPTKPRPPYAEREHAWRLIRYLSLNLLTLEDAEDEQGASALRDFLTLLAPPEIPEMAMQIRSLTSCRLRPVTRKLPGAGPLVYGRGVQCRLTVDETGFSGSSPFLFGLVLSRLLSRHASVNTFTETELHSVQRGMLIRWPVSKGGRPAL